MAEKRMFTKKVTDDENFVNLSSSAQALYLHLAMSADDDGFTSQVSVSMFKAHASVQDMEALLNKRYIYQFDDGVIVIKHWRMANALRKDRYTPTAFQDDLQKLGIKENGSYTLVANRLPDGCQVVAVDKDSIDKNRVDKNREDKVDYLAIIDLYHEVCISFPHIGTVSDNRKKAIKARLKKYTIEDFRTLFEKAEASDFLKGGNDRNWSADFDWLIKDSNMPKVLEGKYDNKAKVEPKVKPQEHVPDYMRKQIEEMKERFK